MARERPHITAGFVCALLIGFHSACGGQIIYVDGRAAGAGNGSSWQDAYPCLQDALAAAMLSATRPVEVRVAQAVYKPDQGAGIQAGDAEATFPLFNGLMLKGGYAGLAGPDPNAWDPNLYETVLCGDLQDNDDFGDRNTFQDNSHRIITADGTDATAVLEAVTVAHACCYSSYRTRVGAQWPSRAGVHNRAGSPTVRGCTFTCNLILGLSGGAMLNCEGAAPRLEGCTFEENGGSVLFNRESTAVLTDCRFLNNQAGGIAQYSGQCELERCTFTANGGPALYAEDDGYAAVSHCVFTGNRGAITGRGSVFCTDSVFTGNRAEHMYGAVGITDATFIRCRFRDNLGAIFNTTVRLEDCAFVHNRGDPCGAVGCYHADIRRCLFAGNRAEGAGALTLFGQSTLTNCTIVGNRSPFGVAVSIGYGGETLMTNCIVRDNGRADALLGEILYYGRTTVAFSCLTDPPPFGINQIGCRIVDPCFVDPGYWDPNGTADDPNDDFWVEGDYHLKSQAGRWDPAAEGWIVDDVTSPCIDAGDPNSPIGEEPFPNGGRINMGTYGGTAEASKSYFPP